jgi:hypothetical protein
MAEKLFKMLNKIDIGHDIWKRGEYDSFLAEWATLKHIKEAGKESLEYLIAEQTTDQNKLPLITGS